MEEKIAVKIPGLFAIKNRKFCRKLTRIEDGISVTDGVIFLYFLILETFLVGNDFWLTLCTGLPLGGIG